MIMGFLQRADQVEVSRDVLHWKVGIDEGTVCILAHKGVVIFKAG